MYILVEQIMNGTITMEIIATGIEASTFQDAIIKVKNLPNFGIAIIHKEDELEFSYSIITGEFPCYGRMGNKFLKVI